MIERNWRRSWTCAVGLVLSASVLSGCDATPNPKFEQKIKEQQAQAAGDPYASLYQAPSFTRYVREQPMARRAIVSEEVAFVRANYGAMLEQFNAEPAIAAIDALVKACSASFTRVAAFPGNAAAPQALQTTAEEIVEQLKQCRDDAIAAEKAGDETTATRANVLRRFASTGVALLGAAMVVQGEEQAGVDLWRSGEELSEQDRPGFKFNARMLLEN